MRGKIVVVVDTSALEASILDTSSLQVVTVPEVLREASQVKPELYEIVAMLANAGRISLATPKKGSIETVMKVSKELGELARLSPVDVKLLAVALDLLETTRDLELLTNDISIQNVAAKLGIPASGGYMVATKLIRWMYYCPACGATYDTPPKDNICARCGHTVKRKPKTSETIKRSRNASL